MILGGSPISKPQLTGSVNGRQIMGMNSWDTYFKILEIQPTAFSMAMVVPCIAPTIPKWSCLYRRTNINHRAAGTSWLWTTPYHWLMLSMASVDDQCFVDAESVHGYIFLVGYVWLIKPRFGSNQSPTDVGCFFA